MREPIAYAVKHKDDAVRMKSQSGGVFTAVSDWILDQGGVVYGCILDSDFSAIHVRAENRAQRDAMRGSKYIQSVMGDMFGQVKSDLSSGRMILFTGTSCQVAGLKAFLGKEYPNLLCMDIICHGVPSPKVWKSYLAWQEKKNKSKVIDAVFRNKEKFGWQSHVETLRLQNGKEIHAQVFKGIFYGDVALRPSCYRCPYKSINHPGDITFADCWGIEKAAPNFLDKNGVSLLLLNNDRAIKCFDKIKENTISMEIDLNEYIQQPMIASSKKSEKRNWFWRDYNKRRFGWIAAVYGNNGWIGVLKKYMVKIIRGVKK